MPPSRKDDDEELDPESAMARRFWAAVASVAVTLLVALGLVFHRCF